MSHRVRPSAGPMINSAKSGPAYQRATPPPGFAGAPPGLQASYRPTARELFHLAPGIPSFPLYYRCMAAWCNAGNARQRPHRRNQAAGQHPRLANCRDSLRPPRQDDRNGVPHSAITQCFIWCFRTDRMAATALWASRPAPWRGEGRLHKDAGLPKFSSRRRLLTRNLRAERANFDLLNASRRTGGPRPCPIDCLRRRRLVLIRR